jgi:hypothetical protein
LRAVSGARVATEQKTGIGSGIGYHNKSTTNFNAMTTTPPHPSSFKVPAHCRSQASYFSSAPGGLADHSIYGEQQPDRVDDEE